jgi:hypothetical protein
MTRQKSAEPAESPQTDEASAAPSVAQALHAVQKAMEDLASLLGADPEAAVNALKQAGQAASDNLAGFADDARDIGKAGLDEISDSVRRNPLPWLAGALGLGLIIGLWRNRAHRS